MTTALAHTLEDLIANPKKYEQALGIKIPTFDEFRKNPEKYKQGPLELLGIVEQGPENFRRQMRKIRYHVNGEELPSLEAVEKRVAELGWNMLKLDIKPELESVTGGKIDVHVKFVQKGAAG